MFERDESKPIFNGENLVSRADLLGVPVPQVNETVLKAQVQGVRFSFAGGFDGAPREASLCCPHKRTLAASILCQFESN